MDYVVDLRKDSPTYLKWEAVELNTDKPLAVLVPAGIGNAFLSLDDNTIHFFAINKSGKAGHSKQINYADPQIGLKLEIPITQISDYDLSAPLIEKV